MERSREYYEDKLADYQRYRRGRTLYQFCKDEGIDYNWFLRAQRMFGSNPKNKKSRAPDTDSADVSQDFIRLHYLDDTAQETASCDAGNDDNEDSPSEYHGSGTWTVGEVTLTDPDGNEITVRCGSAAALGSLLTKLAVCHD